jgi:hypothetical protein
MKREEHFLHRQIHPAWVQDGRVTSQAFCPTPKDDRLLSVYDGARIAAEPSFVHYTVRKQLSAIGTLSVSSEEVTAVGLSWNPDPEPFPEHAVIDFRSLPSMTAIKVKAQTLAECARRRGWTYFPQ